MNRLFSYFQKKKIPTYIFFIYVMVAAYTLSFIILFMGSNYTVNSSAAGINNNAGNEIQIESGLLVKGVPTPYPALISTEIRKNSNTYSYTTGTKDETSMDKPEELVNTKSSKVLMSDDNYWFMGYTMKPGEFDTLMDQMKDMPSDSSKTDDKELAKSDKAEDGSEQSFSISVKESPALSVSKEEREMLERIVEAEASGEDLKGKILIANVVLNRTKDHEFPDTIEGVIFQQVDGDYQFSPISDNRYWSVNVSDETKKAVRLALEGEDYSKGALYFVARTRTNSNRIKWFDNNLDWLFKHGRHEFFK